MAVDILITALDRHKDLGKLCFRDISEVIAFRSFLASNERVPRELQAKAAFDLERKSLIDSVLC